MFFLTGPRVITSDPRSSAFSQRIPQDIAVFFEFILSRNRTTVALIRGIGEELLHEMFSDEMKVAEWERIPFHSGYVPHQRSPEISPTVLTGQRPRLHRYARTALTNEKKSVMGII